MKSEDVKDKIEARHFHINRVPRRTFIVFKELADNQFCGDYGMTLKMLVDEYMDDTDEKIKKLQNQIDKINERLDGEVKKPKTFGGD